MGKAGWTTRLVCSGGLDESTLSTIPASHGVVCVSDSNGGVIGLASTGDMRSFAAQRLGPGAEGASDLREVAAVCELAPAGSMFEADLAFMDAALEREPGLHDRVTRKLRVWWLGTFTDARRFAWSWETDPAELAPGSAVIGPFLEKSGARRHAELLDAQFELCRYPEELHKAPAGKACVYKQMGRCPAACDGSETTRAYEARLAEALTFDRARAEAELERFEHELREATAALAFERAAEIQSRREALAKELKRGLAAVRRLEMMSVAAVATSGDRRSAAVLAVDRGRWARVGELAADAAREEADRLAALVSESLGGYAREDGVGDLGVLGVLSREMMRPSRGGPMLIERAEVSGKSLLHAAVRVLRIRAPKAEPVAAERRAGEMKSDE